MAQITVDLNKITKQQILATLVSSDGSFYAIPPEAYKALELYGKQYKGEPLPKQFKQLKGPKKSCFQNSFNGAISHSHELTYVEGVAFHDVASMFVLHAWCINNEGKAIDLTWDKPAPAYLGIPLKHDSIKNAMAKREKEFPGDEMYYGFLDDWQKDWAFLKELPKHTVNGTGTTKQGKMVAVHSLRLPD